MGAEYFIVDIDRDRHRSGQKTFFYLYDMNSNKKTFFEADVPHIYTLPPVRDESETKRLVSELEKLVENEKKRNPAFRMDIQENDKEKVIQLVGDRGFATEIEKVIGKQLIDYSVDKTILLRYPTSAIVTIEDGKLVNTGRRANLEEYFTNCQVNFAGFDIETKGDVSERWLPLKIVTRDGKTKVINPTKKGLDKICKFNDAKLNEKEGLMLFNLDDLIDYNTIYHIGSFIGNNEKDLLKKLLALEEYVPDKHDYDLFVAHKPKDFSTELIKDLEHNKVIFVWNQNIKNFDLRQLRELADFKYARSKGGGAFQKEVHFPGFQVGDSFPFAMHYLGPLPRYNLEKICQILDIDFKKSLSHGELHRKLLSGKKVDLQEATNYLMEGDIIAAGKLAKRLTVPVIRIADAYEEQFTRVSNQTVKLASSLRDRRFFEKHRIPRFDRTFEMQEFEMYKEIFNLLTEGWLDKRIHKGVFENVKVLKSKLPQHLLFPHEDKVSNLAKLGNESDNFIDKLIYSRAADAYCEEPLFDLLRLLDGKMPLHFFEKDYGNFDAMLMYDHIREYAKQSELPIINYAKDLIFVPENVKVPEGKYVELFKADKIISVERGRVVAQIGNKIISPGIDLEKKSNSINFVKEMYPDIVETYFEKGYEAVMEYFRKKMHDFNSGNISIEDLLIRVKRNQEIYAERAKTRLSINIIEAMKLKKGESGIALLDSKEAYRELWFGEIGKDGKRKLSDGSLGDVLSVIVPGNYHRELDAIIGEGVNGKLSSYDLGGEAIEVKPKQIRVMKLDEFCEMLGGITWDLMKN